MPLRAAAARFPLTHPAVASVLIGARSAAEITDAIQLRRLDIPAQLWESLPPGSPAPASGSCARSYAAELERLQLTAATEPKTLELSDASEWL